MLNLIWATMIVAGVIYGVISGNISEVGNGLVDSSKEAVNLCITMLGVMSFWCGAIKVADSSGLTDKLTKRISPFVDWMFPRINNNKAAKEHISVNIISNVLGMGWAATPAGLKAMKELAKENERRGGNTTIASDEMCTFLILNISSLQIIPISIIAYRSQYGAVNPAAIVGPAIIATFISTLVAVIFCKIMSKNNE